MRGSARIFDVRMAQFVLRIEKSSHIIGARGSQDLRSPSPIMAPGLSPILVPIALFAPLSQQGLGTSVKALSAKRSENGYGDENGLSP